MIAQTTLPRQIRERFLLAKKGIRTTGKDFLINGSLLSIICACGTALYAGDSLLPNSLLAGFGGVALGMMITRNWPKSSGRMRWSEMASIQQMPSADPDFNSYRLRWRPEKSQEFIFHGLGLPAPISETRFTRFIGLAIRRQRNVYYGSSRNMFRTENDGFRKLKRHEILAEGYFTEQLRPRFLTDEFYSILIILAYTRLFFGRDQGTSGRLNDEWHLGVTAFVSIAKERWLQLSTTPPRGNLFSFFKKIAY